MVLTDPGTDGLIQMFTNTLGISGNGVLILFAILISIGLGMGVASRFKEGREVAGLATFFMSLGFFVFIGWITWIVVIIPLILISAFEFYSHRGGQ